MKALDELDPILRIKDLSVTFQNARPVYAVRGVSFELYEGEALAIVGESGCGKSLTAKAILGLINTPSVIIDGMILYNHCDLLQYSESQMQKVRGHDIGMIFQDSMASLNPTMRIGKQITEALLQHIPHLSSREAKRRAIELLRLVGIPDPNLRFDQYPHEFSGGMRQRVMIAIALAPGPKILIADEPTTALDVTIQAQILDLLKEIQQKTGTSILFITHDLSLVASFCQRVLVMYAGRIVESASVFSLFKHPTHPYTARLLSSIPRIDKRTSSFLRYIEGAPPDLSHPLPGCNFCTRCHQAMNICWKHDPPEFITPNKHTVACWLQDARAKPQSVPYTEVAYHEL